MAIGAGGSDVFLKVGAELTDAELLEIDDF
jgi:hypothetical protein